MTCSRPPAPRVLELMRFVPLRRAGGESGSWKVERLGFGLEMPGVPCPTPFLPLDLTSLASHPKPALPNSLTGTTTNQISIIVLEASYEQ